MPPFPILYEDCKAGAAQFGPHDLAVACAAQTLGVDRHSIKRRFLAVPKKGDSKVRAALRADFPTTSVGVVLDLDRVHACYGLPKGACKSKILSSIRSEASAAKVVLINQNMDDLVQICCDLLGRPRFASKPTPINRDSTCQALAAKPELFSSLLDRMPTFARLVRLLVSHASTEALNAPCNDPH